MEWGISDILGNPPPAVGKNLMALGGFQYP